MGALPSMSVRMLRAEPSTPVDRASDAPSTTVNDGAPLANLDVAAALSLALARSGMSHKQAAITQGVDIAQWGNGCDHARVDRRAPAAPRLCVVPKSDGARHRACQSRYLPRVRSPARRRASEGADV